MPEYSLRYERRRYGRTTYTWVYVTVDGVEHSLGDPWPCMNPKRSEIDSAVRLLREGLYGDNRG